MILVFFYKQQREGDIIPTENRRARWLFICEETAEGEWQNQI